MTGKRAVVVARVAVGVLLVALILRYIDLDRFLKTLAGVRPIYFIGVCALFPVGLLIIAARLRWILGGYRISLSLWRSFDINWIAAFANNFLPTSIGGDLYRAVVLFRENRGLPAQVGASVVLDRGLGLIALIVLGAVASTFFIGTIVGDSPGSVATYAIIVAGVVLALGILFARHGLRVSYTSRFHLVNKLINGINVLIAYPDKPKLALALVASFVYAVLSIVSNYLLFAAFDANVSLLVLLFVVPLLSVVGMIPVSINSLGVTEGAGILLFAQFGLEPELVLTVLLAGRVLQILCSCTGGLRVLFARENIFGLREGAERG